MSDTPDPQERISKALGRIKAQVNNSADMARQFDELKAKRDHDLGELDALVAQLKPLVGED